MNKPQSLQRSLGLWGAVFLGLGSILGTGVFVSLGLAAGIADNWSLMALGLATGLATCNALSSAQLAANHPVSGGTYAYGYRYLRPEAGFLAGLAFLLAKSASAAAAAIGVVGYASQLLGWENAPLNLLAVMVVVLIVLLVIAGLRRANLVNAVLVLISLSALVWLILTVWQPKSEYVFPEMQAPFPMPGFFEAAALLFVAFTGYGRIATLGAEVKAPRRTIPRAIIVTLLVSGVLYFGVLASGLSVLGADLFYDVTLVSSQPLKAVAYATGNLPLANTLAIAAVTAMAGVLLNLVLGLSRIAYAMGREGDLPAVIGRLDAGAEPRFAVLGVGAFIAALAAFGGLELVWSFSAFTVLIYYAITNLCALRLSRNERLYPRFVSVLGLAGCLGLAVSIDPVVILIGSVILVSGLVLRAVLRRAPR